MLRSTSIAILLLAGAALTGVLLSLLALRLVVSALLALSGIRRRAVRRQVLSW
jgi:hypothetical protein